MKVNAAYVLLTIFILMMVSVVFGKIKNENASKGKKFEYKVIDTKDERVLNQLGAEGWELHSVVHDGAHIVCFLKRSD